MLGRPFGAPNAPDFQRKVLRALLSLFERASGPVLEDFPEDAPATDAAEEEFACPVSFAVADAKGGDLGEAMRREIAQLSPWYDLAVRRRGRTTMGVSGMAVEDAAVHAASYLDGAPRPVAPPGLSAGVALKRACDDIKAYNYEAVAAQPGNLSSHAIDRWFWRETAAAKVFLAIQQFCLKSSDESLQPLGKLSLIPPRRVPDGGGGRAEAMIRSAVQIGAAMAILLAFVSGASAQSYPVRVVKLVVPSSPGGGSDFIGRVLASKLSDGLGQQVVVENRPGASSVIGADFVAKSAPDGYTVLISPAALTINPHMYARMPFDTRRDLAPVSLIVQTGNLLSAHPSLPVRSAKELIALARKNPGKLACASPGVGGSPHMAAELLRIMAGIDFLIVSYKGSGPGTIALLSGEVSFMFSTPPSAMPFVRTGRLRALAVTTRARMLGLPEVPSFHEVALPGYEATQWFGLLVPAGTPQPIIERLYRETARAIQSPDMKQRLLGEGLDPVGSKPEEFAAYIYDELDKWGKVIKAAGIKPQGASQ